MIERKFAPNVNLFERMQPTKLNTGISYDMSPMRLNRVEKLETNDFKSVFSGLIENFNQELAEVFANSKPPVISSFLPKCYCH